MSKKVSKTSFYYLWHLDPDITKEQIRTALPGLVNGIQLKRHVQCYGNQAIISTMQLEAMLQISKQPLIIDGLLFELHDEPFNEDSVVNAGSLTNFYRRLDDIEFEFKAAGFDYDAIKKRQNAEVAAVPLVPPFVCYLHVLPAEGLLTKFVKYMQRRKVIGFTMPLGNRPATATFASRDELIDFVKWGNAATLDHNPVRVSLSAAPADNEPPRVAAEAAAAVVGNDDDLPSVTFTPDTNGRYINRPALFDIPEHARYDDDPHGLLQPQPANSSRAPQSASAETAGAAPSEQKPIMQPTQTVPMSLAGERPPTNDTDAGVGCMFCHQPAGLCCSRCAALYCSGRCQEIDWPHHSRVCTRMPVLVPVDECDSLASRQPEVMLPTVATMNGQLKTTTAAEPIADERTKLDSITAIANNMPPSSVARAGVGDATRSTEMRRERIAVVPLCRIPPSNSTVCMTDVVRPDRCYIRPHDPQSNRRYGDVLEAIRNFAARPESRRALAEPPVVGQVVLAKHPRLLLVCRAMVLRVPPPPPPPADGADGAAVAVAATANAPLTVAYIDYGQRALVRWSECQPLAAELQRLTCYVHRVTVSAAAAAAGQLGRLRGKRLRIEYEAPYGAGTVVRLTEA